MKEVLNSRSTKKLGQFLFIWLFVYVGLIIFHVIPDPTRTDNYAGTLLDSAGIALFIYGAYWTGYDKGAKDVRAGNNKELHQRQA